MRILYVLTSLGVGGAEKQTIALAERMAAKGHAVALIVLKHTEEEWPVRLPVMRLNLKKTPLGIFRGLLFARKFLTLFRPDLLHGHTFPANMFTRLLQLPLPPVSLRGNAPVVVNTIHNVYEGSWLRMLIYLLTRPMVDYVTAVSDAAAERFIRLRAISPTKLQVVTNGIDTEAFKTDRGRRRTVRSQMHAANAFVWLAAGRLVPAKDYPNLLRAWAQVREVQPKAQLWIAGEGEIPAIVVDDGENALSKLEVRWLGLRQDIADLMDAADGFVLSSAWEGMPLAVGEAMSIEKVVVATDVGGVRQLVKEAGFVVPPHDGKALAQQMLKVIAMTERSRREIGQAARRRIQVYFSMDAKAEEWQALYRRISKQE